MYKNVGKCRQCNPTCEQDYYRFKNLFLREHESLKLIPPPLLKGYWSVPYHIITCPQKVSTFHHQPNSYPQTYEDCQLQFNLSHPTQINSQQNKVVEALIVAESLHQDLVGTKITLFGNMWFS